MSKAVSVVRGILGLFFDDGTLALVILALLMVTGFARRAEWISEPVAMSVLIAGTVAALFENVLRFSRRAAPPRGS